MIYNFTNLYIKNVYGKVEDKDEIHSFSFLIINALLSNKSKPNDWKESCLRYDIAKRLWEDETNVNLSVSEIELIRNIIFETYDVIISSQILYFLENNKY